jgi:hypothetical protein
VYAPGRAIISLATLLEEFGRFTRLVRSSELGRFKKSRLFCSALVAVTALAYSASAVCQTKSDEETQQQRQDRLFRERVVGSWGWRPGTEIKLTTTDYARTYLARYSDRRQLSAQIERGVVLFQTKALDIVVAGTSRTSVWIINRRTFETLWSGYSGAAETGEFVQIVDGPPLELSLRFSLRPATGLRSVHYLLFSLDGPGHKLLSLRQTMDFGRCPSLQEDPGQSIGAKRRGSGPVIERGEAGTILIFPQESVLTPLERRHCATDKLRTATSHVCTYANAKYECSLRVDKPLNIDSVSELQLDGESLAPDEASWLVSNLDELERHGFKFSDEVVEQLRSIAEKDESSD